MMALFIISYRRGNWNRVARRRTCVFTGTNTTLH